MENYLINNIFKGLLLQGILLILFGILIFIYKDLLSILVAAFLIFSGLMAIVWGVRIKNILK
ncbi:MAG: hypothetical protein PHX76_03615 [Patescibacteria group bacterium]|jgi:uncharacterized membrane protein HdeD (DUF308 family)|nr:hypothetical protein [Patescibacteria group bacterium]